MDILTKKTVGRSGRSTYISVTLHGVTRQKTSSLTCGIRFGTAFRVHLLNDDDDDDNDDDDDDNDDNDDDDDDNDDDDNDDDDNNNNNSTLFAITSCPFNSSGLARLISNLARLNEKSRRCF